MAVVSSGEIKLNGDVNIEINGSLGTNVSLSSLSTSAGKTAPHGLKEFYGYTNATVPSVTTNSASNVGTSSMVLNGNVTSDGGATVTSRGFYFGTSSNYASNTKYTIGSGTGSFSTTRSGLSSNTTYYFTAFAINSEGETRGSTVSQQTSFNYTFKRNIVYRYASISIGHQYQNINGSWINGTMTPTPNLCSNNHLSTNHCTNRLNRFVLSGSSGSTSWDAYTNQNYFSNGCGLGTSTVSFSVPSSPAGGGLTFNYFNQYSDYVRFNASWSSTGYLYYNAS